VVCLGVNTYLLTSKFERIGARVKFLSIPPRRQWINSTFITQYTVRLNIGHDRAGEFFEISPTIGQSPSIDVLDIQPSDRHLLLLIREEGAKSKFLCGHDERHWFVAGIPESAPVGTVRQAKEALQPTLVKSALARVGVSGKSRIRRKNAAFIRQGEWFFVPNPNLFVDHARVRRNEPLIRGIGGKPHWAEYCYRIGGETVYVSNRYPNGVTELQYRAILSSNANANKWPWKIMKRNPGVYVRGRIRHPDHATITLHGWHQVVMNTENQSRAMRNVAFLD